MDKCRLTNLTNGFAMWFIKNRKNGTVEDLKQYLNLRKKKDPEYKDFYKDFYEEYFENVEEGTPIYNFSLFIDKSIPGLKGLNQKTRFIRYMSDESSEGEQTSPSEEPSFNIEGEWKTYNNNKLMDREVFQIYGISSQINELRKAKFKRDVISKMFYSVDSSGHTKLVRDIYELQLSIIRFKNLKFITLVSYLYGKDEVNKNKLYLGRLLRLNEQWFLEVMKKAKETFNASDISRKLSDEFGSDSHELTDAVAAYLDLKYFDELLHEQTEGLLESIPDLKGKEVGYMLTTKPIVKYTVNPDSKGKIVGWNTADYRDGIKESSNIVKMLVESVEITDKKGIGQGNNLTIARIIKAWSSLIYGILNLPESNELSKLADKTYDIYVSPLVVAYDILNYIFKNGNQENSKLSRLKTNLRANLDKNYALTEYDINVLRTVYNTFFSDLNVRSISRLENKAIKEGNINLSLFLFSELIPGMLVRVNPINYLETIYDRDKGYITRVKPRYDSLREEFNYIELLNSNFLSQSPILAEAILNRYKFKFNGQRTISLNLNGEEFTLSLNNNLFTNGNAGEIYLKDLKANSKLGNIKDALFTNPSGTGTGNFLTATTINKLLNYYKGERSGIDRDFLLAAETLRFIDDMLNIGLTTERGLNILQTMLNLKQAKSGSSESVLNALLSAAGKVAYCTIIRDDWRKTNQTSDDPKDIKDWLGTDKDAKKYGYKSAIGSDRALYKNFGQYNSLNIIGTREWLKDWFSATALYLGTNSKATTRNKLGNSIPNTRPSSLAGQVKHRLVELSKTGSASLLFNGTQGVRPLIDLSPASDLLSEYGVNKTISLANTLELMYNSFVNNFLNSIRLNNTVATQLTTYADKILIAHALIDIGKEFVYKGNSVQIYKLSDKEIQDLWFKSVGSYFIQQYNNVISDLTKILGLDKNTSVLDINSELKKLTYSELEQKRRNYNLKNPNDLINLVEDLHYRNKKGVLYLNEEIIYYNDLFTNRKQFNARVQNELRQFAQGLLDLNFTVRLSGILNQFLSCGYSKEFFKLIGGEDYKKDNYLEEWVVNDRLVIAKDEKGNVINPGNKLPKGKIIYNPLLVRYFNLDNLISANLKYALVGAETFHPDKSKINISLNPSIFTAEDIIKYSDLISIYDGSKNEKDDIKRKELQKIWNNSIYTILTTSEGTQYKRNVIVSATFLTRDISSLRGNNRTIKVAIMEDPQSKVFNINGDFSNGEDAHDGSGQVHSWETILMNGSLGDLAVGYDITKPIGYHYDSRLGVMTEFKFAAHTISNAKMRLSRGSTYNMYEIFKRDSDLIWSLEILDSDITNNKQNSDNTKVYFKFDITSGKEFNEQSLHYKEFGNVYEITDLKKVGNTYYTIEINPDGARVEVAHLFDSKSEHIKVRQNVGESLQDFYNRVELQKTNNVLTSINSLFKLWSALGGINSGYMSDSEFVYDESSNYAVVNFMNNYNISNGKENPHNFQTKDFYDLPLKDMFISYNVNKSAVKCGQFNVNTLDSWNNNSNFSFIDIDTLTFGPQLDSDHTADDAEMSEFTQVMSSIDVGGKLHWLAKSVFQDLGHIAEVIASDDIKALQNWIVISTNPDATEKEKLEIKSEIYHIIGKAFIDSNKARGEGLGKTIIKLVNSKFKINNMHYLDELKLPFSDPNIYSQVISSYMSKLNGAIKRKHPGLGMVITPGYNIGMFWEIDGNPYLWDDLYREAIKGREITFDPNVSSYTNEQRIVNEYLLELQSKQPLITRDLFEPTDIIDILSADGKVLATVDLDDMKTYYDIYTGKFDTHPELKGIINLQYRRNIIRPKNLRPQRVTFQYNVNGTIKHGNLFNLKPVYEAFISGKKVRGIDDVLYNLVHNNKADIYDENGILLSNVDILPDTIVNEAAECIASNIYKTKLGQENRSLNDILVNGINTLKVLLINIPNVDLIFVDNKGYHGLVTFTEPTEGKYIKLESFDSILLRFDKHRNLHREALINGKYIEIGRGILKQDLKVNSLDYIVGKDNKIVDDLNKYTVVDGKVYENIDYIKMYERSFVSDNLFKKYKMFFIDEKALKNIFQQQGEFSEKGLYLKISRVIGELFNQGHYGHILLNSGFSNLDVLKKSLDFLKNSYTLNPTLRNIVKANYDFINKPKYDPNQSIWKNGYGNVLAILFGMLKQKKQIQFEASRYFTVARIPAQSLLSYMQMKLMGYINSNNNVAMVSHWLTWLQGSDYDIDKAYMMGFSFDSNGNFLEWSPLFNSTTKESFMASMLLPTPKGKQIVITNDSENYDIDVSEDVELLNNLKTAGARIRVLAKIISEIDSINKLEVLVRGLNEGLRLEIQQHEDYVIDENYREEILKNSVSGKLLAIVQDIENIPLSYSYITMRDLQKLASNTEKGIQSANMSGMNPLTKFVMLYQNMVGKQVIGIAAVGEKIFMGNTYYYNDLIREKDSELLKKNILYLTFEHTFSRILGRHDPNSSGILLFYGIPTEVTKKSLTDVNFKGLMNPEIVRESLFRVNSIRDRLSKLYKGEELEHYVELEIKNSGGDNINADLMISQLLSAATDNAKELILRRINADPNMAGIYLNLLMLGFDISDIVAFMTSPAIEVIADRTLVNMFDKYNNEFIAVRDMDSKVNEALGEIRPGTYLLDKEGIERFRKYALLNSEIYDKISDSTLLELSKLEGKNRISNSKYILAIVLKAVFDEDFANNLKNATFVKEDGDYKSNIKLNQGVSSATLINDIVYLSNLIRTAVNKYKKGYNLSTFEEAFNLYKLDIDEYKHIHKLLKETTLLGTALMGLNLGIKTSQTEILARISRIEKFFDKLVKKYSTVDSIIENKPYYQGRESYIEEVIGKAKNVGILDKNGNSLFSFIDYLLDRNNYREIAAEYYNMIKEAWNIFDIMNRSPLYKALLDVFTTAIAIPTLTITKNKILNVILLELKKDEDIEYLNEQLLKNLERYTEKLLIAKWLSTPDENGELLTFPVLKGLVIINSNYLLEESDNYLDMDLTKSHNRMSFKKWIEDDLLPSLIATGTYEYFDEKGDKNIINVGKDNKFLNSLIKTIIDGTPNYRIDVNIDSANSSEVAARRFLEILNDLNSLSKYKIGKYSITDYLGLYNLGVSLNHYGNNYLTGLFREIAISDKNSFVARYMKSVGELDFSGSQLNPEDLKLYLRELGYDATDALMDIALPYNEKAGYRNIGRFTKVINSPNYKKWNGFNYSDGPSIFPEHLSVLTDKEKIIAARNLQTYGMIHFPNYERRTNINGLMSSKDVLDVKDALLQSVKLGLIKLKIKC